MDRDVVKIIDALLKKTPTLKDVVKMQGNIRNQRHDDIDKHQSDIERMMDRVAGPRISR